MSRTHDDGLIYEGTVMVRNRRIEGSGFFNIGNTTELKLKADSEKKQRTSKQKGSHGQALDTITIKKPTTVSFKLNTFDRANLALALMGSDAVIEAKAVTTADQPLIIAKKGEWYAIGRDNLDAASVKVKNAASANLEKADFEINANLGLIRIQPECSKVQDGEEVKITHSTRALGGFRIHADTVADFDLEIMVDGKNRTTGKEGKLHIPSAVVAADSEIDWFAEDFNEASFSGDTVLVPGYPSSYSFAEFN